MGQCRVPVFGHRHCVGVDEASAETYRQYLGRARLRPRNGRLWKRKGQTMKQTNGLDSTVEEYRPSGPGLNKLRDVVADKLSAAADLLEGQGGGAKASYGGQAAGLLSKSADY